jgi:ketose-bisphosphate aldolase
MIPPDPRRVIADAVRGRYAIPALNANNMETVQGIVAGAERTASPMFLQVSPGAIAYAGYETITTMALAAARHATVPILVHLDHCRDPNLVHRALRDGFPSVMFDGSLLDVAENAAITASLVEAAESFGAIVEAELGVIGGSENMTLDEARARMTSPEEAARFAKESGAHILAPALGNLHRMPDDSVALDLDHLRVVAQAAGRPLALHGASGIQLATLGDAIAAGVVKVNISTRVGRAFAAGIRGVWARTPDEVDLRRFVAGGREGVAALAARYAALCGSGEMGAAGATSGAWSNEMAEPE